MKFRTATIALVGFTLTGAGLTGLPASASDTTDDSSTVTAESSVRGPVCPRPAITTDKPATNKRTGYEINTDRGTIHLRHGRISDPDPECGYAKYTWASVKNPTDTTLYIRLEVDTSGNKQANATIQRPIHDTRWTRKRSHYGNAYTGAPEHRQACVVRDPNLGCNSAYATSWWPVS